MNVSIGLNYRFTTYLPRKRLPFSAFRWILKDLESLGGLETEIEENEPYNGTRVNAFWRLEE